MKTIVTTATAFSAVVFLAVPTASAIDTNSVSFNAGADLRVRQEIMGNVPGTPGGGMQSPVVRNKSKNQMRFRMRAWGDLKLGDHFLIRMGLGIIAAGIALLFVPFHSTFALIGFVIIGLGCAPIDPCFIHMTPSVFGEDKLEEILALGKEM